MSEAAKPKSMAQIAAEAQGQTRARTATRTTASTKSAVVASDRFANIEGNTFFKITFGTATPEEKKAEITKALTFNLEDGKEKNAERMREFDVFKEYLQDQRKVMAQEILELVDTGTFSELKSVIEELNNGLIEFDERMKPLTDILDAVYRLRMEGGADTFQGIFQEIQEDAAAEEQRKKDIADTEARLAELSADVKDVTSNLSVMKNSKSGKYRKFFGMGGLKDETIRAISDSEQKLAGINASVDETAAKLADLNDPNKARQSQYQDFLNEKAQLRQLLDISSQEHTERQKDLVAAVQNFINTSSEKTTSVQGQLESMRGQIDGLGDANNGMRFIYTIVTDASNEALLKNDDLRKEIQSQADASTSEIEKLDLEQKKGQVDDYLTNLHTSNVETVKTLGDLTTQGVRIKAMKDTNREQTGMIRELGSSGVAGMADRLVMAVNAVGAAATNESGQMAQMTVNSMNQKTNAIVAKEAIRAATGLKTVAEGLERAAQEVIDYRELSATATQITRENLAAISASLDSVRREAEALDGDLKQSTSAQADVVVPTEGAKPAATTAAKGPKKGLGIPSPFGR
jgi:hypothetical protein